MEAISISRVSNKYSLPYVRQEILPQMNSLVRTGDAKCHSLYRDYHVAGGECES